MVAAKKYRQKGRPSDKPIAAGMIFGHLRVIQMVHKKEGLRWVVECQAPTGPNGSKCGKRETIRPHYLRRDQPKTSCGCMSWADANPYPREKGIWHMMHVRTEDPRHVSYHHYGGRGIKVCPEWHKSNPKGWDNFIAFMGPAPSKRHSIDRVDPNLGYQPFQPDGKTRQVRWATAQEQAHNQRRHHPERNQDEGSLPHPSETRG